MYIDREVDRASLMSRQQVSFELNQGLRRYLIWAKSSSISHWAGIGFSNVGSGIERFLSDGTHAVQQDSHSGVQCQLLSSFALADSQEWIDDGLESASSVLKFLDSYALVCETKSLEDAPVYASRLSGRGEIVDARQTLEGLACQLLAYASCQYAFGGNVYESRAESLSTRLEREFSHPCGGWKESSGNTGLRLQSSHMALFEAFIFMYIATADKPWLISAGEVFKLFKTHFYDQERGLLLEYFNQDWSRAGEECQRIVPSNMLKWVWLLRHYEAISGTDVEPICEKLYNNALDLGRCNGDFIYSELFADGKPVTDAKHSLPITAWLRASLAQASFSENSTKYDYELDALVAYRALDKFHFAHLEFSQFADFIAGDDQTSKSFASASTLLNHVMCALEVQRHLQKSMFLLYSAKDSEF